MTIRIVRRKLSNPNVHRSLFRLLRENVLCSMSTVTPKDRAYINTAYYAYSDELEIFFFSYPDSLHCRNLRKNSSMAMTIFGSAQVWGKPDRGMQLFGTCLETRGSLAVRAEQIYGTRFPKFTQWKESLGRSAEGFRLRPYRFLPRRVKILDEPQFGAGVFIVTTIRQS